MSKGIALEEAKKRIFLKHKNKIEIIEYRNAYSEGKFKCNDCKYVWFSILKRIELYGCINCNGHHKRTRSSVSFEDAQARIWATHGNKIELIEYKNITSHAKFKCNICNNIWKANANSVCRGNGCPECKRAKAGSSQRFSHEEVKKHIEEHGCELISKKYVNSKTKLEIKFSCGHVRKMAFEQFQIGQRCPCIAKKRTLEKVEKESREKVLRALTKNNLTLISFKNNKVSWDSYLTYECSRGHVETRSIRCFMRKSHCGQCRQEDFALSQKGKGGSNWQGGITMLRPFLKKQITDWKKSSAKSCNYKCVISGERFDVIHHLYSFNAIMKEAINNLNLETYETIGEYREEDLFDLADEIVALHDFYGNGVCLRRDIHRKFHKTYGYGDNTPEQFEEFKQKIASGEIKTKKRANIKVKEND